MKSISIFVSNDYVHDQRMRRFAKAFIDLGWQVHVFAILKKKSLPLRPSEITCTRLHVWPESGAGFYLKMNWRFFLKGLFSNSDYLLSVDVDTLMGLRLASLFKKNPLIWDCHEVFTEMPELYQRPGIKRIWSIIEKTFGRRLSKVIASTQGVANYLHDTLHINATVIHNYPQSHFLNADILLRFNSKIILFQGALNDGRCLPELILSMHLLPQGYSLLMVGDGPLRRSLEKLVITQNLSSRIQFAGMLAPEELILRSKSVCMGISLLNKEHYNSVVSLANKNLDYIMAGLPCITVNLPEYKSLNEKWKVASLIETVDKETIASAILEITNDFDKYQRMHMACVEARKYLNWEREVIKLNKFIQSL